MSYYFAAGKDANVSQGLEAVAALWSRTGDLQTAKFPDLKTFLRFHNIPFDPFAGTWQAAHKATLFLEQEQVGAGSSADPTESARSTDSTTNDEPRTKKQRVYNFVAEA
jgi:hypothetical protein